MVDIQEDVLLTDYSETTNIDDASFGSDFNHFDLADCALSDIFYGEGLELGEVVVTDEDELCPDLNDIQDRFVSYVKKRELEMLECSYVEQMFSRYACSIDDIIGKSRTELWFENSIYGLQFQAFLCLTLNISLPAVPKRNRKIRTGKSCGRQKFNDPILECLTRSCSAFVETTNIQRRLAPRNQISILIFTLDILNHPYFQNCVRWQDKASLTFEIIKPNAVAYFWMMVKDNEICSFENFTRAIRFKRNAGVFKYIDNKKRRVYQFHQKALKEYKSKRYNNELSSALFKILVGN